MKTFVKRMLRKIDKVLILFALLNFIAGSELTAIGKPKQNSDSASYISLTGKIIDKDSRNPIMFANIFLTGTSIGTVANADGEFLLKVPNERLNGEVSITHIGYKNFKSAVEKMRNTENTVVLEPELISLKEIIIQNENPVDLLKKAIQNIPKNYRNTPSMVTGFYRETIKQNRKYVSVAEAVLETYKAPYDRLGSDKVKIVIGRKSQDVKKMDTVVVKLEGGPVTPFILDIVKNPEDILSEDIFKYYNYSLSGQVSLDNTRCYVVEFDQKPFGDLPLYKGKIYIEADNYAIAGLEFSISEYGMPLANSLFVKKKPLTLKFETQGADYYVRYVKSNGKWNLNYVRAELKFKCKWKRRLFSSTYATMSEMAVTDIDTTNINKFKTSETTKLSDIFSDKVEDFKNTEFWGDYNIIKPDESIQTAINKLSKKLKKK